MKKNITLNGSIRTYIKWPLYLGGLLVVMTLALFLHNSLAALFLGAFTLIYLVVTIVVYFTKNTVITSAIVEFAANYGQVQKELLKGFVIPYALLDDDGRFVWANDAFLELFQKDSLSGKSVTAFISGITKDKLPNDTQDIEYQFEYEEKVFRAILRRLSMSGFGNEVIAEDEGSLITLYLFDETELNEYIRRNWEESLVTGVIYMDNLQEALETVDAVRGHMLTALVDKRINKYFAAVDGIVRRTDEDKYFVVIKRKAFDEIAESKFSLLEEVKSVKVGHDNMPVTLSMGFGLGGRTYLEGTTYAKNAIDLALGRGGDQAVIKSSDTVTYVGGKREQVERTTRVKSRIKAQALREIIEGKERVIVMGHARPDTDSFGSCVGIAAVARYLGKECHIVINEVSSAIAPVYNNFVEHEDYKEGTVINSQEALSLLNPQTMVVVVDTSRPSITECPELLKQCKTIVLIDHHRMGSERIENAVLSYIETFASSASEIVTEILQYVGDDLKLRKSEADCLYSGIMIDTDNFTMKANVKTFEAAAFLRRNGADVTRIRKVFRDDISEYKILAEAMQNVEIYRDGFAISVLNSDAVGNNAVIGAKAANTLLNIKGVRASFVCTFCNQKIYISARALDDVNVQIIMEKMGGGGHLTVAGAQLEGVAMESVLSELKQIIDEMIDNQEI